MSNTRTRPVTTAQRNRALAQAMRTNGVVITPATWAAAKAGTIGTTAVREASYDLGFAARPVQAKTHKSAPRKSAPKARALELVRLDAITEALTAPVPTPVRTRVNLKPHASSPSARSAFVAQREAERKANHAHGLTARGTKPQPTCAGVILVAWQTGETRPCTRKARGGSAFCCTQHAVRHARMAQRDL